MNGTEVKRPLAAAGLTILGGVAMAIGAILPFAKVEAGELPIPSQTVGGLDTRRVRPADLAGTVATVFQDPEDQVVMARVRNEVAFGLENGGIPPAEIWPRAERALHQPRNVNIDIERRP